MTDSEQPMEQTARQGRAPEGGYLDVRRIPSWARIAGLVVALPVVLVLGFAVDRALSAGEVLRGVSVAGIALAGLDRAGVERAVHEWEARVRAAPLRVRVRGKPLELLPEQIGARFELGQMVDDALEEGRRGGFIEQIGFWLARFGSPRQLPARVAFDAPLLEKVLQGWDDTVVRDPPFDGAVVVRDGVVAAEYPRGGHLIDRIAAERWISQSLGEAEQAEMELPLIESKARLDRAAVDAAVERARGLLAGPVVLMVSQPLEQGAKQEKDKREKNEEEHPDELRVHFTADELAAALQSRVHEEGGKQVMGLFLDAGKVGDQIRPIRARVERPPEDARFVVDDRDQVRIVPSRMGVRLLPQKVAAALLEAAGSVARSGLLPIEPGDPPEFSTEAAVALHIDRIVSKMTTYFTCCQPRVKNIHRIAAILDGRIVRPGETLSVNAAAGERTIANGFVLAPGIEDGEMVDSVGGGVSQFATTLFNAVFYGGYEVLERQAHSYYFSRYPMGIEATLSWPWPDLVFRNDTDAGMLIKTISAKTSITVKIFGNNGGRKVTAKKSPPQDVVKPPVELVADPTLPPHRSKVKESGSPGWSVIVARILTFPDGTHREEKRKVTYKPRVRRVRVHPCRIPEGQEGYTGEPCPVPEKDEDEEETSEAGEPLR